MQCYKKQIANIENYCDMLH